MKTTVTIGLIAFLAAHTTAKAQAQSETSTASSKVSVSLMYVTNAPGEKIVIGDKELDITFSYLPSSEDMTKAQQQLRGPGGKPATSFAIT